MHDKHVISVNMYGVLYRYIYTLLSISGFFDYWLLRPNMSGPLEVAITDFDCIP